MLRPFAIAFKYDLAAVGRIARACVDTVRLRQAAGLTRPQVHLVNAALAVGRTKTHDHALAVGRKARRERHAGKIPDDFALSGLKVHDENARLLTCVRHVDDFLIGRRKARCQHQVLALAEQTHIGAVLIHDGETLDAFFFRSRLIDVDDASVEIALFTRQTLINLIRDQVAETPPILRCRCEALPRKLLARDGIVDTKFRANLAVGAFANPANNESVGADCAPIGKTWCCIDVADLFKKRSAVQGLEKPRALKIGLRDIGDIAREFWIVTKEQRNGDGDGGDDTYVLSSAKTSPGRGRSCGCTSASLRWSWRSLRSPHLSRKSAAGCRTFVAVIGTALREAWAARNNQQHRCDASAHRAPDQVP